MKSNILITWTDNFFNGMVDKTFCCCYGQTTSILTFSHQETPESHKVLAGTWWQLCPHKATHSATCFFMIWMCRKESSSAKGECVSSALRLMAQTFHFVLIRPFKLLLDISSLHAQKLSEPFHFEAILGHVSNCRQGISICMGFLGTDDIFITF